jgi:hypothetical protein
LTQGQFEVWGSANGQKQRIFGRKPENARLQASTRKIAGQRPEIMLNLGW